MEAKDFIKIVGVEFFVGVPDSLLKGFCDYVFDKFGTDKTRHIIAANEGNCCAIGAGYHLATGKVPLVYMQNSGIGNIINPAASLLHNKVYGIPVIFLIGFRGEPFINDEPQHIFQGEITLRLLEDMDISYFLIDKNTTEEQLKDKMVDFNMALKEGKSVAFVAKKDALTSNKSIKYFNKFPLNREEVISCLAEVSGKDIVVSTTGKISRELYEIREKKGQKHGFDFLTVGSMGHSSSIALGIASFKPQRKIWCIDGDGAALMHLGAMAILGEKAPENLVHIIINNAAHESVGGMPTAAEKIDFPSLVKSLGYKYAVSVSTMEELKKELQNAKVRDELSLIEIKCSLGSRSDLGRPTKTPKENKLAFIEELAK